MNDLSFFRFFFFFSHAQVQQATSAAVLSAFQVRWSHHQATRTGRITLISIIIHTTPILIHFTTTTITPTICVRWTNNAAEALLPPRPLATSRSAVICGNWRRCDGRAAAAAVTSTVVRLIILTPHNQQEQKAGEEEEEWEQRTKRQVEDSSRCNNSSSRTATHITCTIIDPTRFNHRCRRNIQEDPMDMPWLDQRQRRCIY